MKVLQAYTESWRQRAFVIPILFGVRLLSLAVIAPLTGIAVQLAISLSGQSALTDQDIAHFIFTPLGFPVFLLVMAIWLIGGVLGLAAMTVHLSDPEAGRLAAIRVSLGRLSSRFAALVRFAAEIVVRVLLIALPFVVATLLVAQSLIGLHDINYYLSVRPPEFGQAVTIGAGLLGLAGAILAWVLLGWALALHFVLFGGLRAPDAFAASRTAMDGRRVGLLRDGALWFALRAVISLAVAGLFGWLIITLPGAVGGTLGTRLLVTLAAAAAWGVVSLIVDAVSLGALARLLFERYYGPEVPTANARATPQLVTPVTAGLGILAFLVFGVFLLADLDGRIKADQEVAVIAHRGASGAYPENTMAAIRAAVEQGADWVEIDVQETADGEVVVMHDSDFMKLANRDLKIWDATMADLAEIDIGSWFAPEFSGERVPTLAEALAATQGRAGLLIELKYYGKDVDLEARTIGTVEAAGMADEIATMSLKYPAVQKLKTMRPDWPSGVLAATGLGDLTSLDGEFLAVSTSLAGPRLVRRTRAQGKQLFVWTVNDPLEMSAMISMGVDGLITDEPALARQVITERAGLNSYERLFLLFLETLGLSAALFKADDARP